MNALLLSLTLISSSTISFSTAATDEGQLALIKGSLVEVTEIADGCAYEARADVAVYRDITITAEGDPTDALLAAGEPEEVELQTVVHHQQDVAWLAPCSSIVFDAGDGVSWDDMEKIWHVYGVAALKADTDDVTIGGQLLVTEGSEPANQLPWAAVASTMADPSAALTSVASELSDMLASEVMLGGSVSLEGAVRTTRLAVQESGSLGTSWDFLNGWPLLEEEGIYFWQDPVSPSIDQSTPLLQVSGVDRVVFGKHIWVKTPTELATLRVALPRDVQPRVMPGDNVKAVLVPGTPVTLASAVLKAAQTVDVDAEQPLELAVTTLAEGEVAGSFDVGLRVTLSGAAETSFYFFAKQGFSPEQDELIAHVLTNNESSDGVIVGDGDASTSGYDVRALVGFTVFPSPY